MLHFEEAKSCEALIMQQKDDVIEYLKSLFYFATPSLLGVEKITSVTEIWNPKLRFPLS